MSDSCITGVGQNLEGLATPWIVGATTRGAFSKPLREYLDGRTRTRRGPEVLVGSTAGIICTVTIGPHGEVEAQLDNLPERLAGTRPFLSFPAAASAAGVSWGPGPWAGIVRVREEVSPAGQLRCLVARSRSRAADLPRLLERIRVLSEEGRSQPLCSIEIGLRLR